MKTVRDCSCSAEAEANGHSVLSWLRAFTFAEHAARIDADKAAREARWAPGGLWNEA